MIVDLFRDRPTDPVQTISNRSSKRKPTADQPVSSAKQKRNQSSEQTNVQTPILASRTSSTLFHRMPYWLREYVFPCFAYSIITHAFLLFENDMDILLRLYF